MKRKPPRMFPVTVRCVVDNGYTEKTIIDALNKVLVAARVYQYQIEPCDPGQFVKEK